MAYTTAGFASVEVEGEPPGNVQAKLLGDPVELLVNCTVKGAQPPAGLGDQVKAATGVGGGSVTLTE